MRMWKLAAGLLSILFSFVIMLQSAFFGMHHVLFQNGQPSAAIGLLMAALMFLGGLFSILSRSPKKNRRNLYLALSFGAAAYLGMSYPDSLKIWTGWCFLNAVLGLATFIKLQLQR